MIKKTDRMNERERGRRDFAVIHIPTSVCFCADLLWYVCECRVTELWLLLRQHCHQAFLSASLHYPLSHRLWEKEKNASQRKPIENRLCCPFWKRNSLLVVVCGHYLSPSLTSL